MEQYLFLILILAFLIGSILLIILFAWLIRTRKEKKRIAKIKKFKEYLKNFDLDKDTEKFLLYIADFIKQNEDPDDLIRNNLFFEKICTRFLNNIPEDIQQYWEKIYKNLRKSIPFKQRFPYLKTTRDIKVGSKVQIKVGKKKTIYITAIFAENTPFYFIVVFEKKGIEKLFKRSHYYDFFLSQYKDSLYLFTSKALEISKGFIKFEHPEEINRVQRRKSRRIKTKMFIKFKFKNNKKILNGMMINLSVKGCGVLFTTNPGKKTTGEIIFQLGEAEFKLEAYIKNINKLKNNYYYCSIIFVNIGRVERAKIAKFMKFRS